MTTIDGHVQLATLAAAVAGGNPDEWKLVTERDFTAEEASDDSLQPQHGNDVYSITILENASLGAHVRVEYDQEDYVFVDASNGHHFSGPLEDEVHILATTGNLMAARQAYFAEQTRKVQDSKPKRFTSLGR